MYFIQFHSVNVKRNWTHLAQKNSRPRARINTIFRLSRKYFNRISITIETFLRYLVCFAFRVLLFKNNSVEKNMNLQQALFFSLLKKTKLIKEKKNIINSYLIMVLIKMRLLIFLVLSRY